MIDESDNGRVLAKLVADRVLREYPRTGVQIVGDLPGVHGTIVTFTPPNKRGAVVTLFAIYEWWFDIDVGRFKLFETEPMRGSETEHVARVADEILRIAHSGYERGTFDRLIAFGRDRVEPWES